MMREFLARQFRIFLLCHLFIAVDTAIIGQILEPDAQLSYLSLWGPLILAALCVLPSFVMYGKEELPVRKIIVRRALQVALIEAIVLTFLYIVVPMRRFGAAALVAASVLIVYGLVWFVDWAQGWTDAKAMNRHLERLKGER